jgi:hypothetical protein
LPGVPRPAFPHRSIRNAVLVPHRFVMPAPFIAPCDDGYRFAKR